MAYNKTDYVNSSSPYLNSTNLNNNENQHYLIDNLIGTSNVYDYSSSSTYDEGDLTIYNHILYRANQDISIAESFTAAHWNKVVLLQQNTDDKIPIGSGFDFYGTIAPENYMFADGSEISRTIYSELFDIIGTTYGVGDGSTTFNLPDKRARVTVMAKSGDDTFELLGSTGGEKTHTLTIDEIPTHSHPENSNTWMDANGTNSTKYFTRGTSGGNYCTTESAGGRTAYNTKNAGGGESHNNLQPYLVCNYIIKVK